MSDDDPRPDDPETKLAVSASELLVIPGDAAPLVLADPDRLVEALRYLAQRIPGFTQLSTEEERKLTRVAFLDPEFLEAGVRAGRAWDEAKGVTGLSGEEMRDLAEENRRWDELESTVRAFLKGISARNRKERHRLGDAILTMYGILGRTINREHSRHLRPLYEEMKRAYMRSRRHRGKGEGGGSG
ncbi:MAG: hypothetical protein DMF56_10375 [Acidobacteria bacterium]|nr:MAG: hypothetical protein DMF56_10375 [Acidobacteriota bacterium]